MTSVTHIFYVFVYSFNSLHVSSTSCSSSGETNCVNITSDSCHSVSVAVWCTRRNERKSSQIKSCVDLWHCVWSKSVIMWAVTCGLKVATLTSTLFQVDSLWLYKLRVTTSRNARRTPTANDTNARTVLVERRLRRSLLPTGHSSFSSKLNEDRHGHSCFRNK